LDIAAGEEFACAVTQGSAAEGSPVYCWGRNDFGQLGKGTLGATTIPTRTLSLPPARQVAAGKAHTCAVTQAGTVLCWGANDVWQVSPDGGMTNTLPVNVVGLTHGAVSVTAGGSHSCAVLENGTLWCWGANNAGQLGNGERETRSVPTAVQRLAAEVTAAGAGALHTCALLQSGAVQCWGANVLGQVGNGATVISPTLPITVTGLESGVVELVVGAHHSCARSQDGKVRCWGVKAGQYPYDSPQLPGFSSPQEVPGAEGVANLSAGGIIFQSLYPPYPPPVPTLFTFVLAETCGVTNSGEVRCWQMGQTERPYVPQGLERHASQTAVGGLFACALRSGGAFCWGANSSGQLGNANPWSPFWVRAVGF
jgi:alpha-tubulin suppressor-like RCC1 family protein